MKQLDEIRLAGAVLYPHLRCIRKKGCGAPVILSRRQAELLEALALCAGKLVTNRMLCAVLYGRRGQRVKLVTLTVLVCRLRKKLEGVSGDIRIFGVCNQGYVLVNL